MPDSRSATPKARKPRPRNAGRRRPQREHARPFKPFTPEQLAERAAAIPVIEFPDLPVSERREEIDQLARDLVDLRLEPPVTRFDEDLQGEASA